VDGIEREGFDAALAERGLTVRALATVSGHNLVKGTQLEMTLLVNEGSALRLAE